MLIFENYYIFYLQPWKISVHISMNTKEKRKKNIVNAKKAVLNEFKTFFQKHYALYDVGRINIAWFFKMVQVNDQAIAP